MKGQENDFFENNKEALKHRWQKSEGTGFPYFRVSILYIYIGKQLGNNFCSNQMFRKFQFFIA